MQRTIPIWGASKQEVSFEAVQAEYRNCFSVMYRADRLGSVITSATYKLHHLIGNGNYTYGVFAFPAERSLDYFRALESLHDTMPANLSVFTYIVYNATSSAVSFD
jgi:hypothetical protein